jgi:hypothetical protein
MAAAKQTKRAAHGRPHSRRHGRPTGRVKDPPEDRLRPATHVFIFVLAAKTLGGRPSPAMTMQDEVRPEVIQLLLGSP